MIAANFGLDAVTGLLLQYEPQVDLQDIVRV